MAFRTKSNTFQLESFDHLSARGIRDDMVEVQVVSGMYDFEPHPKRYDKYESGIERLSVRPPISCRCATSSSRRN